MSVFEYALLQGDCRHTAGSFRDGLFDLIYVDPPFCSGRRRRLPSGAAFEDRWTGDVGGYLAWLLPRAREMRRILAPTGSIFFHLDWHAVHAAKVALDEIFGRGRFINEIIWSYRTGGTSGRYLARKHDTLLFYARTPAYKFHPLRERSALAHRYGFANAGVQEDEHGPYRMTRMRDVWEIPALRGNSRERVDFPTQKPLALLERIIDLVTDPGDRVGDFLCGSGTALVAALGRGRRAYGGDISAAALAVTRARIHALAPHTPA